MKMKKMIEKISEEKGIDKDTLTCFIIPMITFVSCVSFIYTAMAFIKIFV